MTTTDKQGYWLVNEAGVKAFVVGAAERDRWVPLGWTQSSEPTGNEFLYARMDGIADPAKFPAASFLESWGQRGWMPCAPPDPESPFVLDAPPVPVSAAEQPPKSVTREK